MPHEQALAEVNQLHDQLASITRSMVEDFKDGRVTPLEGFQIGMQCIMLGQHLLTMFQRMNQESRDDLLYVLEYGQWSLVE